MIANNNAMHSTILKPVEILITALDQSPTVTPIWAQIKAQMTICLGELARSLAVRAGMTNKAPINNEPTARRPKR